MEKQCVVCGHPYPEEHHIVFRGQQSAMIKCPLNKISLCNVHHRGDESPHQKRELELKYKIEFQERLEYLFSAKECYEEEEIKNILLIPAKDARKVVKSLCTAVIEDEVGYKAEDIIRQCMGGRLYK